MPTVRRFLPLLTLIAVLLAAPAARAALTSEVDAGTKTVTISGDDAADLFSLDDTGAVLFHNIPPGALESQFDFDTAPGTQNVPADETYRVVVNTGGGDDTVTIETSEAQRMLGDLGAGNDHYQGSTRTPGVPDEITGGGGHDRIATGRNPAATPDRPLGGDGNDTLVWNNGDGNDELDGQGGADTVEVNGSPVSGDSFLVKPQGDRVRLDRVNLGLFFLLIAATTERLQVNGLGGPETMTIGDGLAALGVGVELNGGTGHDTLTGGDAADTLNGGDDIDSITGGAGDDRIAGDRGDDTLAGGDGDDTLVWNNGDGTDKADGDGGSDVMEVNGAAAGDAFTIKANGARTQLDRTNLVPFGIDIAAERLDLDTLGGDDSLTVSGAPPMLLDVDGGAGNDTLTGDAGHESLRGGGGADRVNGGGGSDVIDGDDGDDELTADDGQADIVRCGAGSDRAKTDREGIDAATDCELLDRPIPAPAPTPAPTPGPKPAAVQIATGKVTVKKLRARIRLACPAGAITCQGRLTLTTPRAVKVGRVRVIVVLGSASYRIAPGTSATVTVKLSKALRAIARKAKSVRVAAVASSDAGGGATLVTSRRVTLVKRKRW